MNIKLDKEEQNYLKTEEEETGGQLFKNKTANRILISVAIFITVVTIAAIIFVNV